MKINKINGSKFIVLFKWVWILAVLFFSAFHFVRNYEPILASFQSFEIRKIILSGLVILFGKLIQTDLTRQSLLRVNHKIDYICALSISSITQLGKYIPGGIWQFLGKAGLYKTWGLDLVASGKALIIENFWMLYSAILIGLGFSISSQSNILCQYFNFFCLAQYQSFLIVGAFAIWLIVGFLSENILFPKKKPRGSSMAMVRVEEFFIWVAYSVSFWLLLGGVSQPVTIEQTIGIFNISWAAGFVAFFAPGGLGIRDLLLSTFLGDMVPYNFLITVISLHRLLWFLTDIFLGLGSSLVFGIPLKSWVQTVD